MYEYCEYFSPSPKCFILLLVFYEEQKVLTLMSFKFSFSLKVYAYSVPSRK